MIDAIQSFNTLDHQRVLLLAEQALGEQCSALCLQRNSYINRVYECEVRATKSRFILKFYRPDRWTKEQILEEHRLLSCLAADDISVIVPMIIDNQTLQHCDGFLFAIFPKMGGRVLDELSEDLYQEVGRLLARVHVSARQVEVKHRQTFNIESLLKSHLNTIIRKATMSPDYESSLNTIVNQIIAHITPLFSNEQMQLIHGDCHFGNIIHRPDEGLYLLDFDDCALGPIIQDIWMLLPNNSEEDEHELRALAEGYNMFADFPYHQLRLIPSLRAIRQIHFMAWCAVQCEESHFKHHFPDWGNTRYWNESVRELQNILFT